MIDNTTIIGVAVAITTIIMPTTSRGNSRAGPGRDPYRPAPTASTPILRQGLLAVAHVCLRLIACLTDL